MEYNEEKALELIKKFSLSLTTNKVWKSRGAIPDKYLQEDYTPRVVSDLSSAQKITLDRVLSIFKGEELNAKTIEELCGFRQAFFSDLARSRTSISNTELNKIVVELQRLKLDIKKAFDGDNPSRIRKILSDKRVKPYIITKGKIEKARISYFLQSDDNPYYFTREERLSLKDAFFRVVLMITV